MHQYKSTTLITEKLLSIVETPNQQEEIVDDEKVKFICSQILIWNFFRVPTDRYLDLSTKEKSAMFKQYYNKLVAKCYGKSGKLFFSVWCLIWFLVWYFLIFCMGNANLPIQIDSGISQALRDASKITMVKNIFSNNRIESTLTAEKSSFKRNTAEVWKEFGHFKQQPCDFGMDKENLPENSIIRVINLIRITKRYIMVTIFW